jgi:hypothetical protein
MGMSFLSGLVSSGAKQYKKNKGGMGALNKMQASMAADSAAARGAGSSASSGGSSASDIASYKRGGRVRKTGKAKLHKGEKVLTRRQARRYAAKRR